MTTMADMVFKRNGDVMRLQGFLTLINGRLFTQYRVDGIFTKKTSCKTTLSLTTLS